LRRVLFSEFLARSARQTVVAEIELPLADLAAEIVYLVNRNSEVARRAMIAGKVVDELLALPAAVARAAEVIGNPAQNCEKGECPRCKCSISFTMRVARHDKLPK
jgi:hypothetical protein